jgi:2-iminobutanoate/2-iminopropanoate deaminase
MIDTMTKTAISTTGAPAAIGPYSQAIRSGDLLFASGQVGFDPVTGLVVEGGMPAQIERVLANIEALLTAAGLGFADVVKTTVFLKNMDDFATMNAAYAKRFAPEGSTPPARSTIEVARLPKDALVEIEITARFPAN